MSMAAERVVCSECESRDENVLAKTFLPKKLETSSFLIPDYDIISEMQVAIKQLPFKPSFNWVKGHQEEEEDEEGNIIPLSREAQINNKVDELAGQHVRSSTGTRAPSEQAPHLPAARATMSARGVRVTSCIRKELRESMHGNNLRKHIIERNHWDSTTFDSVN